MELSVLFDQAGQSTALFVLWLEGKGDVGVAAVLEGPFLEYFLFSIGKELSPLFFNAEFDSICDQSLVYRYSLI